MQKLDSKVVWLFSVRPAVISIVVGIYVAFISLIWSLVIVFVLLLITWIWAKLQHHFYRYELREDGFRKESGIIWKRYVTIPYNRIQNVDIYRGLVARILGLSDLHIQTAGTAGFGQRGLFGASRAPEAQLPGLSREVAEKLRDELIKRSQQSRTTNQGL